MVYSHRYFNLNTESKKILDENGKELRLTGNAYRMLVFLCKNQHANLTEINEYLDWAKDYSENHIRQYRYKVNTIIGRDIVEYKNGIYSLVGEVKEVGNLEVAVGNTDLLPGREVELKRKEVNYMEKDQKLRWYQYWWVWAIIALFVIVGFVIIGKNLTSTQNSQKSFLDAGGFDVGINKAECLIKGNISSSGEKIYHLSGGRYYDVTVIDQSKGERWFCAEAEAVAAGWRKSMR